MTAVPTLGVTFRPQSPPERLRAVARAARGRRGIAELWLWEDCFLEGGLTTASAALAWTGRLRVGIGLLPVPLRNPALVAMEIATLARLFPGRLLPGLGHGVLDWMAQVGAGVASPMAPAARVHRPRCASCCTARRVERRRAATCGWTGWRWTGRRTQVPPLLVGARGPRTLRLAGELADGVILDSGITPDGVRDAVRHVERGRADAGRTEPPRVVVYLEVADPAAGDLRRRVTELGAAGADTVVLQPPGDAPDPHPLIAAGARLSSG